jgi:hypothetical protein
MLSQEKSTPRANGAGSLAGARVKKQFDLIVIGGGSAGLAHAQRAA